MHTSRSESALSKGFLDLLVGLVLTQRVHGPNGGRQPADDRNLQNQANNSGNRATNGEEGQPGQDEGNPQTLGA